jgi:hypothetical protein
MTTQFVVAKKGVEFSYKKVLPRPVDEKQGVGRKCVIREKARVY